MTKIVTLAYRVWVNKKLKDVVNSKLTFTPLLDTKNTSPNKQHKRLVVAGMEWLVQEEAMCHAGVAYKWGIHGVND